MLTLLSAARSDTQGAMRLLHQKTFINHIRVSLIITIGQRDLMTMRILRSGNTLLMGAAFTALVLGGQPARADAVDMRYRISLAGLALGNASMSGNIAKDRYAINLRAKLNGLVGMIVGGSGAADATGSIVNGRPLSSGYALSASNSQMTRTIRMSVSNAQVNTVAIDPPFDEHPDRVPITPRNKQGIVDPIGALVMPVKGKPFEPSSCDRVLPVYDGAQRFNVTLSYSGTKDVSVPGYAGPALVCSARYTPIAGHRLNKKQVTYMQNNREMSAWLIPAGDTGVLVPFRISVKTQIGTSVIEAETVNVTR